MSNVITPTVGRVVWFWPSRSTVDPKPAQPFAATVAFVFSDRLVNLSVVNHGGTAFSATSVPLVQPGDPEPSGGYWAQWMPYQVGQAAKTEAAEAALASASKPG